MSARRQADGILSTVGYAWFYRSIFDVFELNAKVIAVTVSEPFHIFAVEPGMLTDTPDEYEKRIAALAGKYLLKSPVSPSAPTRHVAFGSAPCLICALG